MSNYDREASAQRFANLGLKTNSAPDALAPNKSPYLANVRGYNDTEMQSRPQLTPYVEAPSASPGPVLSLEANLGYYKIGTNLFTGGDLIDSGYSNRGASLIPFRPSASPNAWEYVFDASKATKANGTTVRNVGIVEPQASVDFGIGNSFFTPLSTQGNQSISYTWAGTAGSVTDTPKINDVVVAVFQDPSLPPLTLEEFTVQVGSSTEQYQANDLVSIGTPLDKYVYLVKDVYPALIGTVQIQSIYYYSGTTGRCVIVPYNIGSSNDEGLTIMQQNILTGIRRGALVTLAGETCYVLGTAIGPDGTISFEVVTNFTHVPGTVITGQPAIKVLLSSVYNGVTPTAPTAGATIAAHYAEFTVGAGIGTITSQVGQSTPFSFGKISYRPDDLIQVSVWCNDLNSLTECKILFDVSNGSFDQDYYYYTFRVSDIQEGLANTLTQLAVAQVASQRETIDEENAAHGSVSPSSVPLLPGSNEWSVIVFPVSKLQRVGGDQTKTLMNINSYQVLVNAAGNLTFGFHNVSIFGGFSPDAGATGLLYYYRIRPRSSITGAKGNPSPEPRYGIAPRREEVEVILPTTYSDPQMDTWDIFRQGGALESYKYVGSVPLGTASFLDNYDDLSLQNNDELDTDLYQPFPTVDVPFAGTANITGTACVVAQTLGSGNVLRFLPGTLVTVGQQVYTLRYRPLLVSGSTYYMEFVENAGSQTSAQLNIYEPDLAQQFLPYVWGPDANGHLFGVGDTLRPGGVYRTNAYDPDSASDKFFDELCAPTEPLQNGGLIGGTSLVASVKRWWRGYPQQDGSYKWVETPVGVAIEFPWALATDAKALYFLGSDGIYMTEGGAAKSLTNDDLYNLFPHEDVYPTTYNYAGKSVVPPDYTQGQSFRLAVVNGFLFFDYAGTDSSYHTLVLNLRTMSWGVDIYNQFSGVGAVTVRAAITAPPNPFGLFQQMYCGVFSGAIEVETAPTSGSGEMVSCVVATNEAMMGDLRADKLYGDAVLDSIPATGGGITITPVSFGSAIVAPTLTPGAQSARTLTVIDLLGGQLERSFGLILNWIDQGVNTTLYFWQPSYIVKPETTQDRFQDWDIAGAPGNKFFQGFLLMADTMNAVKELVIRDADTLSAHAFTGPLLTDNEIQHNGQSEFAYSFDNPFLAHMVRFEPDETPWRFFNIKYISEPTPEFALTWQIQPTGFGIDGYKHPQRILFTYAATAVVTFTIIVDGRTSAFTLPSTAGAYAKEELIFNPLMKGFIYQFSAVSTAVFAVWPEDAEVLVRGWNDPGPYKRIKLIGGTMGATATV